MDYKKQISKYVQYLLKLLYRMKNDMNSLSSYACDQEDNVNRVNQSITQITV